VLNWSNLDIIQLLHSVGTVTPQQAPVAQKQYIAIPAGLVRELMDITASTDDVDMGEIALGLIASIWDGEFQHSCAGDDIGYDAEEHNEDD